MVGSSWSSVLLMSVAVSTSAVGAHAETSPLAQRVLILVNDNMPAESGTNGLGAGVFVGQYYADQRGIPYSNIVHVNTSRDESIPYVDYVTQIENPLRGFLDADNGLIRKATLYIVPTYGIPLRVVGTATNQYSVDSLLAGMYAPSAPIESLLTFNPYSAVTGSRPSHFDVWADNRESSGLWRVFIVARLDGPSAVIAKGLVDKAVSAETGLAATSGAAYIDTLGITAANDWRTRIDDDMRAAAAQSKGRGIKTVLNVQTESLCNSNLAPAPVALYDPVKKALVADAVASRGDLSFSFSPISEGTVVLDVHASDPSSKPGYFLYVTLATSDPGTYIKLTYPLSPFTRWKSSDDITLDKVVSGVSVAKATMKLAGSVFNSFSELRLVVTNSTVTFLRDGNTVIAASDPRAVPVSIRKVVLTAQCAHYELNGITISDRSGSLIWRDTFNIDSIANYTWDTMPPAGLNALWAWGWYGAAFDTYRFVNGAVGAQLISESASTIRKPVTSDPAYTSLGAARWGVNWVPRMLEQGVTATWGAVFEPFATRYPLGGNLFDHFWNGYNFGESFYIANNSLRWTLVAVGDPLYAPKVFKTEEAQVTADSLSPSSGAGTMQSFTAVYSDTNGYSDLDWTLILLGSAIKPSGACLVGYYRPTNSFYLASDAGQWGQPLRPGSAGTLENGQCVLKGAGSTAFGSNNTLKVTASLSMNPFFAGPKSIFLHALSTKGLASGWQSRGSWTVPASESYPTAVVSGALASSTASPQTFSLTGRDADGYSDIYRMYYLVNPNATIPQGTCHGFYDRATNALYLYNDTLTVLLGPLTPGTAGTLQNSQCVVIGNTSSVVSGSGDLTVNIGLGLQGRYSGTNQNVYLWVKDNENHDTGWVQTGTWNLSQPRP